MDPLPIQGKLTLPPEELQLRYSRSGGPGGQNVNKVETKVELRFAIRASSVLSETQRDRLLERLEPRLTKDGVLIIASSEYRERSRNLEAARDRLANLLRSALKVDRVRRASKPTKGSQKRRLEGKRQRSDTKRMRGKGGASDD